MAEEYDLRTEKAVREFLEDIEDEHALEELNYIMDFRTWEHYILSIEETEIKDRKDYEIIATDHFREVEIEDFPFSTVKISDNKITIKGTLPEGYEFDDEAVI